MTLGRSIHREKIQQVTSYRYLGIHLDNLFSWRDHVDCVFSFTAKAVFFTQTECVWCQPEHHVFILSGSDAEYHQVWDDGVVRQSLHTVQNLNCSAWYRLLWRWWGGLTSSPFSPSMSSLYSGRRRDYGRTRPTSFKGITSSCLLAEVTESQNANWTVLNTLSYPPFK